MATARGLTAGPVANAVSETGNLVVNPSNKPIVDDAPTGRPVSGQPDAHGVPERRLAETMLSNVPPLREELLASRVEAASGVLGELRRAQNEHGVGMVRLHGMPGSGKLAILRALRNLGAEDYDILWLIRARHPALAAHDLADLAVRLGIATSEEAVVHPVGMAMRVLRWLSGNPRVLYIFSGMPSFGAIEPYVNEIAMGAIVAMSVSTTGFPQATVVEVPSVPLDEALDLLRWDHSESAELCARTMGGSLLALRLARCFYAAGLMTKGLVTKAVHQSVKRHQNPTVGLLEILLRELGKTSPHLVDLLSFLSFFSSDGIDLEGLTTEKQLLPGLCADLFSDDSDSERVKGALAALEGWGLVHQRDGLIYLHPFVQKTIRERLSQERLPNFALGALGVVNTAFVFDRDQPGDWVVADRLLSNALAVASAVRSVSGVSLHLAHLEFRLAKYLEATQQSASALVCAQECLERRVTVLGEDAVAVVESYRQCGHLERVRGNWLGACHCFERSVAAAVHLFSGSDDLQLVEPFNELGITLARMGQANRARSLAERALALALSAAGTDYHPAVARAFGGYAAVLRLVGAIGEATACTNRAMTVWENIARSENPEPIAKLLADWGAELLRDGDVDTASRALKLALGMASGHAENLPLRSAVLRNLGVALFARGKFAESRARLDESFDLLRRRGASTLRVEFVPVLWQLAQVSRTMGDHVTARNHLDRALQVQRYVFPDERHPDFAVTYYELGVTHVAMINPNAAREALTRALTIHRRFLKPGQDDLQSAAILHELAFVLLSQGELSKAQTYYEQARESKVRHYDTADHPDVANTESMLGQLLWKLGQKEKARELLHHSEWVYSSQYGPEHPKTLSLNRMLEIVR